jgi:hypothetical protein
VTVGISTHPPREGQKTDSVGTLVGNLLDCIGHSSFILQWFSKDTFGNLDEFHPSAYTDGTVLFATESTLLIWELDRLIPGASDAALAGGNAAYRGVSPIFLDLSTFWRLACIPLACNEMIQRNWHGEVRKPASSHSGDRTEDHPDTATDEVR